MAKVMVSFPDELLARVDAEAERRGTTRSGLLQLAAKREIGDLALPRAEIIERLERLGATVTDPFDVSAELHADRSRVSGER